MKISKITLFTLNEGKKVSYGTGWSKNYTIVRISTDEGIDGIGEPFHSLDEPIGAYVKKFTRFLLGRDPRDVMRNWYALYRGLRYPAGTGALAALSALEQAMWDISGKACSLPVYRMLGGPARDAIPLYASGYLAQPKHFQADSASLVDSCLSTMAMGFKALKICPQPDDWREHSSLHNIKAAIERVHSVREAMGDDFGICLDYHGRSFSPSEALQLAKELEAYRPMFLEEPALSDNPDSLKWLKSMTSIPIAAGERCVTRSLMRGVIETEAVHIFQPEPSANGGILETVMASRLAELHQILIAPHHACSLAALTVCAHIGAAIPNLMIQECNIDPANPLMKVAFPGFDRIDNGFFKLDEKPGLGIIFDEEAVKSFPGKPYDRPIVFYADGSIGLE